IAPGPHGSADRYQDVTGRSPHRVVGGRQGFAEAEDPSSVVRQCIAAGLLFASCGVLTAGPADTLPSASSGSSRAAAAPWTASLGNPPSPAPGQTAASSEPLGNDAPDGAASAASLHTRIGIPLPQGPQRSPLGQPVEAAKIIAMVGDQPILAGDML